MTYKITTIATICRQGSKHFEKGSSGKLMRTEHRRLAGEISEKSIALTDYFHDVLLAVRMTAFRKGNTGILPVKFLKELLY